MGYQLIETIEVGSGGAASIEFTAIPQDGVDLQVLVSARNTTGGTFDIRPTLFNGDTGIVYTARMLTGDGSTATSTQEGPTDRAVMRGVVKSTDTANTFGNGSMYISNYTSSSSKSFSIETVTENNATAAQAEIRAGIYTGTSPITTILLDCQAGNFAEYSTASLYKITAD